MSERKRRVLSAKLSQGNSIEEGSQTYNRVSINGSQAPEREHLVSRPQRTLGSRRKQRTYFIRIILLLLIMFVVLMSLPFPILGVALYSAEYAFFFVARNFGPYVRGSCLPRVGDMPPAGVNIGILTGSVGRTECSFRKPVLERLEYYANLQNYTLVDMSDHMHKLSKKHTYLQSNNWLKVLAVEHFLPQFDWVWYVDADVYIANTDIRLEQLLRGVAEDIFMTLTFHSEAYRTWYQRLLSKESEGKVQSGTFFLRNSPESVHLLHDWFSRNKQTKRDQPSLQALFHDRIVREREDFGGSVHDRQDAPWEYAVPRGVRVLDQCAMNSAVFSNLFEQTYMHGDFIMHAYSKNCEEKQMIIDDIVHGRLVTRLQWDYLLQYDSFVFDCKSCKPALRRN